MADHSLAARWGDDLLDAGFGTIPYAILDALPHLGITAEEFLFIIHVFRFKRDERNPYPSVETLARNMSKSTRTIQKYMSSLESSGYLKRLFRPNQSSELDFSGLLNAVRKSRGVKHPSPPEISCTPGAKDTSPPPVKNLSPRTRSSKKETKEKKKKPVPKPPPTPAEAAEQEEKFLDSLQSADEVEGIRLIQEHWRMNVAEGELPAKTAAYWLFANPKGNWNYLEKHGQDKAVQLIIKAMDKAFAKHKSGRVLDLIGYLNAGIQREDSYLIFE